MKEWPFKKYDLFLRDTIWYFTIGLTRGELLYFNLCYQHFSAVKSILCVKKQKNKENKNIFTSEQYIIPLFYKLTKTTAKRKTTQLTSSVALKHAEIYLRKIDRCHCQSDQRKINK